MLYKRLQFQCFIGLFEATKAEQSLTLRKDFLKRQSQVPLKMKATFTLILVVLAAVLVSCNNDDAKCREFGLKRGITEAELVQVGEFKMFGPPRKLSDTCQKVCSEHAMDSGFEYGGRQACCCGKSIF